MSAPNPPEVSLSTLLADTAPNRAVLLTEGSHYTEGNSYRLRLSEILLWCGNEKCGRDMAFEPLSDSTVWLSLTKENNHFILYRCKHCETTQKTFAIKTKCSDTGLRWSAIKLGEFPPFGKPIPAAANRLIDSERAWFVKGLRSEEQGFGIGAFGYYRRVVEHQWARLLERVILVAVKTNLDPDLVEELRRAQKENRFSESVEIAKGAIPPVLLIDGHNPVSLLHSALSEGLHAEEDEYCLDLATSIREVLYVLGQKIADVLKSESKLNEALDRLHQRRNEKARSAQPADSGAAKKA